MTTMMTDAKLKQEAQELIKSSGALFEKLDQGGIKISRVAVENHLVRLKAELAEIHSGAGTKTTGDLKKLAVKEVQFIRDWPTTESGNLSLTRDLAEKNPSLVMLNNFVVATQKSKMVTSLSNLLKEGLAADDFAHPEHKVKEDVGRVYVGGFSYPTLVKELRNIILPDPGCNLWYIDGKGTELVALAVMSGDEKLLAILEEKDFYRAMAAQYQNCKAEEVTLEQRNHMKLLVLAVQYGASPRFLSKEMGISEAMAEEWLANYVGMYQEASKFLEEVKQEARRSGVAHTYFGTRRQFPLDNDVERSCASHSVQSTAGEIFRIAMTTLDKKLQTYPGTRLVGLVFDAFLVSIPKAVSELEVLAVVSEVEKEFNRFGFPLRMVAENCGESWK